MRKLVGPLVLALVVVTPGVASTAGAHAAPDPLDNAVHVLADEGEDTFYWYDGYDLYNLFVREAYAQTLEEPGLVFRFTLYGGFAPTELSDQLAIDIEATTTDGAQELTITTTDDQTWEGDMEVLVANVTEDDPPFTGVTSRMQTFVSYDQLGVAPGASVEDIKMESRADDDVRDVAPGGIFLPNSQGQGEIPQESERRVDSLELAGPHGYVELSTTPTETGIDVTVENTLGNGQHVTADVSAPEAWNASINGSAQTSLPDGETTTFTVEADPSPDAVDPLAVEVVSDLGAHETVYVGVNGTELTTDLEPNNVEVEPNQPEPNESPGLGLAALASLLASLALLTRRKP
jgi:hypothetical protein